MGRGVETQSDWDSWNFVTIIHVICDQYASIYDASTDLEVEVLVLEVPHCSTIYAHIAQ